MVAVAAVRPLPAARTTTAYLPALTGLRFFAALLVVLYHVQITSGVFLSSLVTIGYTGVNFFFVLSGFILTHTYLTTAGRLRGTRRAFWSARFARIYPVYLFTLVVGALPYYWHQQPHVDPWLALVSSLALVQAWSPWYAYAWNGPGWSLSSEAFFYLLFPFLALPLARLDRRQLNRIANFLWLATLAAALVYIVWNPDHLQEWGFVDLTGPRILRLNPLLHLPEFLLGIAFARMFALDYSSRQRNGAAPPRYLNLAAGGALAAIVVISMSGVPLPDLLVHAGLLDPLYGLLIYALAWGEGSLAGLLGGSVLVMLGEASYALYLLHHPLYTWLNEYVAAPMAGDPRWFPYWGAYLCLSIALALLVWHYVEQPARRALRRALA